MDTLRLPAQIESLAVFREFVLKKLRQGRIAQAVFPKIELILEEVLANICNYAYEGNQGEAELSCEIAGDALVLSVSDSGRPFNPLESPPPDLSADIDERRVGGLGIYFVREMVDAIAYERRDGRNTLTMSIGIRQ